MKARVNKKSVVFSEIYDEGTFEMVNEVANNTKSVITWADQNTKAKITTNINAFITAYNNY